MHLNNYIKITSINILESKFFMISKVFTFRVHFCENESNDISTVFSLYSGQVRNCLLNKILSTAYCIKDSNNPQLCKLCN